MERLESRKGKKNLMVKAFERCLSLGRRRSSPAASSSSTPSKSRPWQRSKSAEAGRQRTPAGGCFTVHVGTSKERFVIKTECINHPLFRVLLDEAETAYGFTSPGPLELPCDVELFYKVLCEIDQEVVAPPRCNLARCYSATGYRLLSPSRLIISDRRDRF